MMEKIIIKTNVTENTEIKKNKIKARCVMNG